MLDNMKNFLKQNWREIVGWIPIVFLFLILIGNVPFRYESGRSNLFETFEGFVVFTIFVLSWLKLNKK